ncbi:MAG: hypothetical protein QM396_00715 [Euryarchaeota archaeon]|nr:hypothetical protein [Euryarchaeota archaeon]
MKGTDELKKKRNTSILAPEYYYRVAKRDFGSVSRFFRLSMESYIKKKYGQVLELQDQISNEEITEILISERDQEKEMVSESMDILAENHFDQEEEESADLIGETILEEVNDRQKKIIDKKDYFESIVRRAVVDDAVPPFDYIEKEYGISESTVLSAVERYAENRVFDLGLILSGAE